MKIPSQPNTKSRSQRSIVFRLFTAFSCTAALVSLFCTSPTLAASEWHTQLNGAEHGFWKYRIPLRLTITDAQRAELERRNAQLSDPDAEKAAKNPEANSQTGMNSKLTPHEFTFTLVSPQEKASAAPEHQGNLLPLAGIPAEEIRVCDENGVEYLFAIQDPASVPQEKGILRSGSRLTIPIELTTIRKPGYFRTGGRCVCSPTEVLRKVHQTWTVGFWIAKMQSTGSPGRTILRKTAVLRSGLSWRKGQSTRGSVHARMP